MKLIHLQSSVHKPLRNIIDNARVTVSRVCGGIDDMNMLGNKALVIRAEIYPSKLPALYAALQSIQIYVIQHSLPDKSALKEEFEYPMTRQITSLADDTNNRVTLPKIPG